MKRASALAALAWVLLFALAINVNVAHAFDVAALFALFDGAHRVCVTLASRLTTGPYETVDRALRLRLFLCVCGETWRDRPRLRAEALRLCHAFAR